jgi:hypothetical protein
MTRPALSRHAHVARLLSGVMLLLASLCAAPALAEPTVQLRVSRGPYYAGIPIDLHVHATGFEKEPQPSCEVDPPTGASTISLVGVVPQFNSSVRIVNGRVTRSETATFICQYRFTPGAPGQHVVGPFRVSQSGVVRATERHSIQAQSAPLDPKVTVKILIPEEPVYVGQQLPIEIEWWLDEELQDQIRDYTIESELFHRDDAFRFLTEERPKQGEQTLEIQTQSGPRTLPAAIERRSANGRDYLVVSAERILVPLRSGEFDLAPATVSVEAVTRWQRDLFGGRRPAASARLFGRDEPRRLVIKSAPAAGRPGSFAGAIGRGFTLEVAADRSVVQLGDPITLTITLRGDGNLTSVGPPKLGGEGGLDTGAFRLPDIDASGEIRGESKVFEIPVRVLSDSVREIPALAYAYFDPESEEYRTTYSRPIALSVRPAEVISADDVVNAAPDSAPSQGAVGPAADRGNEADAGRRGSFTLSGADLSIEPDPGRLLRSQTSHTGLQAGLYALSCGILGVAVLMRRRSRIDPALRARRKNLETQRTRIAGARKLAPREAATEVAGALRALIASAPELRSPALDDFLARCDALIYAPEKVTGAALGDDGLIRQAEALLDEIAEAVR